MQIEVARPEEDNVEQTVMAMLTEHSQAGGFPFAPQPLIMKITDEDRIVGGLVGNTNWEWLYISALAVDDSLRGHGMGKKLIEQAERIAIERGCRGAWVNTYSFQAPDFYQKLGYERFGELPDFPKGQQRIFLRKLFAT